MKRFREILVAMLGLLSANVALAQGVPQELSGFENLAKQTLTFIQVIAGIGCVIAIVYAGYLMASKGQEEGGNKLKAALIGTAICMGATALAAFIKSGMN